MTDQSKEKTIPEIHSTLVPTITLVREMSGGRMNSPYNIAAILLRVSGLIMISLGSLGLVFVASFVLVLLLGAPEWFSQSVAPYAVQSILGSPLWIIGGCIIFRFSPGLARLVARACESGESQ